MDSFVIPASENLHRFGLMHRSKQLKLVDRFVGEKKDRELAELAGVTVVNFPKTIAHERQRSPQSLLPR
jgi:hypothetical protein